MRKTMLKSHHLRACMFVVCLCLCVILFGGVASAVQYTMEVKEGSGICGAIGGGRSKGSVRFGTCRELGYDGTDHKGEVLVVPSDFILKADGVTVAEKLYSLELVDDLTLYNEKYKGTVVFSGNQTVWTQASSKKDTVWVSIEDGDWYYSHKSNFTAYNGVQKTESTEACCNFTFQLADNSFVTLQGKLELVGNCTSYDCHLLVGSASMDVKVAHTITLEQDNPTIAGTASVKVVKDDAMPDVTVPQKNNCTFKGYFSEAGGKGTQYYDADGKAYGQTTWDKDEDGTLYAYWTHEHVWEFSAEGDTLYAKCTNTEYTDQCEYQNGIALKILVSDKEYDGQPVEATLDSAEGWEEVFKEIPEIEFYTASGKEKLDEAPSEVGKYTASITAGGVTAKADFTIQTKPLNNAWIGDIACNNITYDGKEHTASPVVKWNNGSSDITLVEGTDYTIKSGNTGTDAGTYTFTIEGQGNYSGTATKTWTINPMTLTQAMITVEPLEYIYTGSPLTPTIIVKSGDVQFTDSDYDVTGAPKTDVGEYTLSITGKNNLANTVDGVQWKIVPKELKSAWIAFDPADNPTYDGEAHTITPTVTDPDRGVVLVAGQDFTVTKNELTRTDVNQEGSYEYIIEGTGNYKGTGSKTWNIKRKTLDSSWIGAIEDITYDGWEHQVSPTIQWTNGEGHTLTLEENKDYTVESGDTGTNVGTYTFTIQGMGNYEGKVSKDWKIIPKALEHLWVDNIQPITYDGQSHTVNPTVYWTSNGRSLKLEQGRDYKITAGETGMNVGTYTFTIEGLGNYAETASRDWEILKRKLSFDPMDYIIANNKAIFSGDATPDFVDNIADDQFGNFAEGESMEDLQGTFTAATAFKGTIVYSGVTPPMEYSPDVYFEAATMNDVDEYTITYTYTPGEGDNYTVPEETKRKLIVKPVIYGIIEESLDYIKASNDNPTFTCEAPLDELISVTISGGNLSKPKVLEKDVDYTVASGSTIVTLKGKSLTKQLKSGCYTIQLRYKHGFSEELPLTVGDPPPKTGDTTPIYLLGVLALCCGSGALGLLRKKKNRM